MNGMKEDARASGLKGPRFTYRDECPGKEDHRDCSDGLHGGAVTLALKG
jgi:hypothetical protein